VVNGPENNFGMARSGITFAFSLNLHFTKRRHSA